MDLALEAIEEAVELYDRLYTDDPNRHRINLARSLHKLSSRLLQVRQEPEALDAIQKAVGHFRQLNGDEAKSNLARSLDALSSQLAAIGHFDEAIEAIQESFAIQSTLYEASPTNNRSNLAHSLLTMANLLASCHRPSDAVEAVTKSVGLYRKLYATNPRRYRQDLSITLKNLANRLIDVHDRHAALEAIAEAVQLRQESGPTGGPLSRRADEALHEVELRLAHVRLCPDSPTMMAAFDAYQSLYDTTPYPELDEDWRLSDDASHSPHPV